MRKIKQNIQEYKELLFCAIIVIALIFMISRIFAIIFISPDDIAYQNIMSGMMTGTPDGHCYFIRYPLAAILALFYKINNTIAWYQLFLLSSLMLSFFLILSRIQLLNKEKKLVYIIWAIGVILSFFTVNVVNLEWTVTAGVLGATALFRYITMPIKLNKRQQIIEYAVCAVLLILCFCLRNTVAYMYIPLAGLCWIKRIIEIGRSDAENLKIGLMGNVIFLLVCLISVGAIMGIHAMAYSNEGWTEYKNYTKDRSALFDYYGYPDYDTYAAEYQQAGISKETYELMKLDYNFVFPCDEFEDIDLKAIADLARNIYTNSFASKVEMAFQTIRNSLTNPNHLILNSFVLILFCYNCFVYRNKEIKDSVFVISVVCWAGMMVAYLAYKGRLPERVFNCVAYGLLAVLLGNLFEYWKMCKTVSTERKITSKNILNAFCVLLCVLIIISSQNQLYEKNVNQAKLAVSKMQLAEYCKEHPDNIYFRDFWSFSQRGELFMRNGYSVNNYLTTGGWSYNSPLFDGVQEQHNFEDLFEAICENENVYYLVSEARAWEVLLRLRAYFASEGMQVIVDYEDEFYTTVEKVMVLNFREYT